MPVGVLTDRAADYSVTVGETGSFFAKVRRGRVALQMPNWNTDEAAAIGEAGSAVSFIQQQGRGFQWTVYLMGAQPLLVDADPQRRDRSPIVFSGHCSERLGKWGLEKPPGHGSGS